MKLIDLLTAREALQKLITQDLPIREAYALMKLTDSCNVHLSFYGQELAKFDPHEDPDRLRELQDLDIGQIEKTKITIRDELRLSAADVRALLPLVSFHGLEEEE